MFAVGLVGGAENNQSETGILRMMNSTDLFSPLPSSLLGRCWAHGAEGRQGESSIHGRIVMTECNLVGFQAQTLQSKEGEKTHPCWQSYFCKHHVSAWCTLVWPWERRYQGIHCQASIRIPAVALLIESQVVSVWGRL